MKEALRNRPFYVFLFPLFYVLHGFVELWAFQHFSDYLPMLLTYVLSSAILLLLFRWIFKDWRKAALMTIALTSFYLLFGAIFDFLQKHSPVKFIYKYSVLLTAFLVLATGLFIFLRRTQSKLHRITFFLNLLLIIYVGIDLFNTGNKLIHAEKLPVNTAPNQANGIIPDTCDKPDIYLLVFDAYSSTYGLQQFFGYDNSSMDSFLISRKFHNLPMSRSNYTATAFSMASQLNMDYLYWAETSRWTNHSDYARCAAQIYNNEVMRLLTQNGYIISNHSIFDVKDHPSYVRQSWRNVQANIISDGTLGSRLVNQFRWCFEQDRFLQKVLPFVGYEDQFAVAERLLKGVKEESSIKRAQPKFVYGHFLIPHEPFYRDKDGNDRSSHMEKDREWAPGPDNAYTGFVQYANTVIKSLIDTIQANTGGKAVIILESDHGYHLDAPDGKMKNAWYNLDAVYFPSGQYQQYNDSITNVNQFRIVFNSLFGQRYPLLHDSCYKILD